MHLLRKEGGKLGTVLLRSLFTNRTERLRDTVCHSLPSLLHYLPLWLLIAWGWTILYLKV